MQLTTIGRPLVPGIKTRLARQRIADLGKIAAAQLPEVQRMLGHSRLSTTGIYLTPIEDDLRAAVERAGL